MLSDLIDALGSLRDEARARDWAAVGRYRFGARDLVVHASTPGDLPDTGLVPALDGGGPPVELFVIDADEAARLPFPTLSRLAPYGALLDSVATDWLVLRSPDTGRVLALDRESRIALSYPGAHVPARERAEFCRPLLHWHAVLDGRVVVHAGGIALDGRGLLVAGPGNAGKSTLTRVCLAAGFAYLGDNVVEADAGATGSGRLYPVYPTFKIRRDPGVPLPGAWPAPQWDDEAEKDIYFLGSAPEAGFARTPVEHVATLILDEAGPEVPRPLDRATAFFRVAPNTVAQFPLFEEAVLTRTGAVVGRAPTFTAGRLPLGRIPETVATLLAEAAVPA